MSYHLVYYLDKPDDPAGTTDGPKAWVTVDDERLANLHAQYGVPISELDLFEQTSDLLFVLKLYTLVEAVMTQVLSGKVPVFAELFEKMSVLGQFGKVAFLEALGELRDPDIKFIKALSTLRKSYAHDVHSLGLSLQELIEKRVEPETWRHIVRLSTRTDDKQLLAHAAEAALRQPRVPIAFGVVNLINALDKL